MDVEPWLFYEQELKALAQVVCASESWFYLRPSDQNYPETAASIAFFHWQDVDAMLAISYACEADRIVYLGYQDLGFLGASELFQSQWQVVSCRVDDIMPEKLAGLWAEWIGCASLPVAWLSHQKVRIYIGYALRRQRQFVPLKTIKRRY